MHSYGSRGCRCLYDSSAKMTSGGIIELSHNPLIFLDILGTGMGISDLVSLSACRCQNRKKRGKNSKIPSVK